MDPVSILPIDVGFDLKITKHAVSVTSGMVTHGVLYEDREGKRSAVFGSKKEISRVLKLAGYKIAR